MTSTHLLNKELLKSLCVNSDKSVHSALAKLMFGGFVVRDDMGECPDLKEAGDRCYDHLIQLICYCQHHGLIAKRAPDAFAVVIWSAIHGFSTLWLEKNFEHNTGDQTEELKNILLDLMSSVLINGFKDLREIDIKSIESPSIIDR